MTTAWLCQIDAFARDDGAAATIRVASHTDDRLCHLNDVVWWPAIARLPSFAYDFFDGAFGGEIVTPTGRADLSIEAVPDFATLMLHGARIRWWSGELGAAWGGFTLRFDGMIDNHPAVRDGIAAVEFRVDDRWLDDPILATYAGTTGAEGEAAQKGQVKPLMLGAPRMVEGVLIDTIDTIIQLSDGAIEGVELAMEGAARFAAPVANYASFAALDAATIAPGLIATGLGVGLVRHGAPGDGVLTYDIKGSNSGADGGGWVRRTGAIVKRLAARQGQLAKVDTAALTALDTARPWSVSLALTSQTTMRQLVQSLAQSINAVALVTWTGMLTILPVDVPEDATPMGTLASDGSAEPPVARVDQLGIAAPWWRVAIEAEVTHRVHSTDEVRFTAHLVERGIYDDAETYREGHIVSVEDGSRWLYIGVTPTAGNDPSDVSAFWSRLSEPATGPAGPALYTWYAYSDSDDGVVNFTTGAPGGRVYVGIAPNQTSATESTDPEDYTWSRYVGPASFGLASPNANAIVGPDFVQKVVATSSWTDAGAMSTEALTGAAQVGFSAEADGVSHYIIGLNSDPAALDFSDIDYAVHITSTGDYYLVESGSLVVGPLPYSSPARFTINYDDQFVRYYGHDAGGTYLLREVAAPADLTFYLDASLWSPNSRINGITWTPGGRSGLSPVAISVSPTTATVQIDKDGQVKSGQIPLNFEVTAMQAGSAIALTSLTINASAGGTFSEDDSKISLTALSDANAEVQFTAVAGGQTIGNLVIAVATAKDGAGGASTSISTASTTTIANQTSYTQVGDPIAMNVSSAGKLKVNFYGMIRPDAVEGYQWQSKIQYSLTGGSSWVDVSGSAKDSSATFELEVPPFGMRGGTLSSADPITVTGLTADAPALVRGLVQRKSGSATASGTVVGNLTLYAEQVL